MKNESDQNFFNFVWGLRQRTIRYYNQIYRLLIQILSFIISINIENLP